jgi:hypothetical protein
MRTETQIVQRVTRAMHCSECGVEAAAACDCGAPYVPAGVAAAKAVAAHPEKSDRAIAAEIGVSDKTVGKARRATAENSAVETRLGLDGKARKRPAKNTERNRKARERRKERDAERDRQMVAAYFAEEARGKAKAERLAADLISADSGLARALHGFLVQWSEGSEHLLGAIARQLGITSEEVDALIDERQAAFKAFLAAAEATTADTAAPVENAPPPDVGADNMRAQIAALDDGLDIPECLRRVPKAAAS